MISEKLSGERLKSTTEYDLWLIGSRLVLTKPDVAPTSTNWEAFWHYSNARLARLVAEAWDVVSDRYPPEDAGSLVGIGYLMHADARPPEDPAAALARIEGRS